jgi:hypothetical protein
MRMKAYARCWTSGIDQFIADAMPAAFEGTAADAR